MVLVVDDNQQNLELIQAYLEDVECGPRPPTMGSRPWRWWPGTSPT